MAVDFNGVKLLLWAKNLGVSFEKTLTLGHQGLSCSYRQFRGALADFGLSATEEEMKRCLYRAPMGALYADEFFRFLGAKEAASVDYCDFEGATLLHDLNQPFPAAHLNRYSFVFDGGTLEHVFDFPGALRHCLETIQLGGHFLCISPADNLMGHGFYQISPELLFRVFSVENGFALQRIVLYEASKADAEFFHVNDPKITGQRTELSSGKSMFVAALARRTALLPVLAKAPQQSDYAAGWAQYTSRPKQAAATASSMLGRLRSRLNLYWPFWMRRLKEKLIYSYQHGRPTLKNRRHFRKLRRIEISRDRATQ